jgi:uncharacterized membrane protein YkgB
MKLNLDPYLSSTLRWLHQHSLFLIRITIGIVFLWFGLLKVFNVSPLIPVLKQTYSFFPFPAFSIFVGVWEIIIGLGFIFNLYLNATLILLWLQMGGIFISVLLNPSIFFDGNPFFLTTQGEFLVKNFIIIAASFKLIANNSSSKLALPKKL